MADTPHPHIPGEYNLTDIADDFPLDVDLRELYLRLKVDGALWAHQQPEDDGRLAAYAVELAASELALLEQEASLKTVEVRAAPPTRKLRLAAQSRRSLSRSGQALGFIAAALVVALLSITLLRLSPLALHAGGSSLGDSVTPVATTNTEPTSTATLAPTATSSPAPRPTSTPLTLVPFMPYLVTQSNGKTISEGMDRNNAATQCSPDWIVFLVDVKFTYSNPGTVTFHWQYFDGSNALPDPSADNFWLTFGPAPGDYTATSAEVLSSSYPDSNGVVFEVVWHFLSPPSYSSTPRWGAQMVITAVNGQPLATPISSDIIELATPAC